MQRTWRGVEKRITNEALSKSAQRVMARIGRAHWIATVSVAFGCSEPAPTSVTPESGGAAGVSAGASGAGALGGAGAGGAGAGGGSSGGASGASGGGASGGAAGAAAGGGAGAAGSGGVTLAPTFASVAGIMQQNCGALSCHGGGPEGQDIVFVDTTTLYDILMSKVVTECGGSVLVMPGDPANSALLQLPSWRCGDLVMPKGCIDDPCLTPPEMEAIRGWISAGAPR